WSGATWEPANWYEGYDGDVDIARAIARSVNIAAVETAFTVGITDVAALLEEVGAPVPLHQAPSLALGAVDLTPFELAHAYAALTDGRRRAPFFLRDDMRDPASVDRSDVIFSASFVAQADWALAQPIERSDGTARSLASFGSAMRGKTGTSDGARDAWFAGYLPDALVVVWVGYDTPRPLGTNGHTAGGGTLAVPVAAEIFRAIVAARVGAAPTIAAPPPINTPREKSEISIHEVCDKANAGIRLAPYTDERRCVDFSRGTKNPWGSDASNMVRRLGGGEG
ncbi:MAG: penicillin-binding transpeptidase domain-containing protein, partial [Candidatus Uhrbacteria bacterium]